MKNNKFMMVCVMSVMAASSAFVFASPYQETTKTTKSSKKTTATTATTTTSAPAAAKTTKSETTKNATDAQIAAAKSAGQVWANTGTKVYHDSSSKFYGATKAGKFMAEKDAIAAGYHKAKNEK